MNILVKSIQDAMAIIPDEILTEAFLVEKNGWRASPITIEESILQKVIRKRVVPDCNIASGEHMIVKLDSIRAKYIQDFRSVYEIPARLVHNKTILSVLSVSYAPYAGGAGSNGIGYAGSGPMSSSDVITATQQMVEAGSAIPNVSTARVELIGENTVMIEDSQRYNTSYHLSCYVTDSNFLNKIDPRSYDHFSRLCEYAIKSYIYKTLFIRIGRGKIESGSVLGEFKDILDTYNDSEENYRTYLREKWSRVAFMDNRDRYRRFIKMQIPIGL